MGISIDPAGVGATGVLDPATCAVVAARAAALIDLDSLDRDDEGEAVMLWRTDGSEAWLNTWWQPRDSGFHDHGGSGGGVHVIAGEVTGEYLLVQGERRLARFGPGDSFFFERDRIHRVDHLEGAVTVHVYSPPLTSIGHYSSSTASSGARPGRPTRSRRPASS